MSKKAFTSLYLIALMNAFECIVISLPGENFHRNEYTSFFLIEHRRLLSQTEIYNRVKQFLHIQAGTYQTGDMGKADRIHHNRNLYQPYSFKHSQTKHEYEVNFSMVTYICRVSLCLHTGKTYKCNVTASKETSGMTVSNYVFRHRTFENYGILYTGQHKTVPSNTYNTF